jgi:hypothetical protein
MNIYLIEQDTNNNYDTFDSAIVAASTEDEARLIHPMEIENWDGKRDNYGTWVNSEMVTVTLIGLAVNNKKGVLLASFNAG